MIVYFKVPLEVLEVPDPLVLQQLLLVAPGHPVLDLGLLLADEDAELLLVELHGLAAPADGGPPLLELRPLLLVIGFSKSPIFTTTQYKGKKPAW